LQKGAKLNVFDPEAMSNVKRKFGEKLRYAKDMYEAAKDIDALIICTEWSIFRTPDFRKLRQIMEQPVIFDGRNLYDINDMKNEGFFYSSIGRQEIHQ